MTMDIYRIFLLLSVVCADKQKVGKRILLSDPNVVQTLEEKIQELTEKVIDLNNKLLVTTGSGGNFVRWGRTTCPSNVSELVYNGYAGTSHNTHTGGAADYICMPSDPQWDPNAGTSTHAYVYGVEYQDSMAGTSHYDDDAPCAVCRTTTTSNVLMIPGRTSCYPGWTKAYGGSLVAGWVNSKSASQYVCLDSRPEFVPNSRANNDDNFFEPVASKCGSLACPPYVDGKRLSCVVCTK